MAKEYIEREAAKRELLSWAVSINHPEYLIKDDALHIIDSIPAADVIKVVRCRECKQGEIDDPDFPDQYYCHAGCGWNNGDFYCSYGERKEGDD